MVTYFINRSSDFVLECLEGTVASVPYLKRLDGFPEVIPGVPWEALQRQDKCGKDKLPLPHVGEGPFRWGGRQEQSGCHLRSAS